jgi:hypothetical protein
MVCAAGSAERTKPAGSACRADWLPIVVSRASLQDLGRADDRARENVSLGRSTIGSVVLGRVIGVGRAAAIRGVACQFHLSVM